MVERGFSWSVAGAVYPSFAAGDGGFQIMMYFLCKRSDAIICDLLKIVLHYYEMESVEYNFVYLRRLVH